MDTTRPQRKKVNKEYPERESGEGDVDGGLYEQLVATWQHKTEMH